MLNTRPYDRKCPEYVGKEGQDYYFLANSCYIEIDTFVGGCPYPSYSAFTKYMTNRRDYIAQAVKNRFWEHVCFYNYLQSVLHTKRILDGHIGVLFYDVTTLYFEADYEDELRKAGFSKEGRHKDNIRYTVVKEHPLPGKRAQNVLIDGTVELKLPVTRAKYPKRLRRIAVWNEEHQYVVEILTNNFSLAASTIAALYKARWEIEIFFRNLKQLLRIKSFIGTSRNVVETQTWTALTTMLLLCWLNRIAKYKWALANLVVSLRLNTFTKIDLFKWLDEPFTPPPDNTILP